MARLLEQGGGDIDGPTPKPPGRVRGRPFEKGQSGNPAGRRVGCRNRTTIAAAAFARGRGRGVDAQGRRAGRSSTTRPPCGSASNAFWRRTATIAAVVDTFVRAIEISY